MKDLQTLDLRGLSHEEKHSKIFPALENLREGSRLEVHFDFNPLPLVYMLQARPDLQVKEEKGGPDEWVLGIEKPGSGTVPLDAKPSSVTKDDLKDLLKEMKKDTVDEATKARAKKLLENVDAKTLGVLEQELIREGVTHEEIRKNLCDIHLEAIRDTLVAKRIEVSPPHPVHTLMEEHKILVDMLYRLKGIVERLHTLNSYESMGADLDALKDIAHHLVEAEKHHQREEEALFPRIEKHDIVEPPMIMKEEHVEFRQRKQSLLEIVQNSETIPFDEFKSKVVDHGGFVSRELESHIFKEDNILYQIALQVLTPEEWDAVKKDCDTIGYCCFTPGEAGKTVALDLRPLPPAQRHKLIFETWDSLKAGDTLRITNDHDPKPLYYQFQAEHTGKFQWKYEQQGPIDWVVRIDRVTA